MSKPAKRKKAKPAEGPRREMIVEPGPSGLSFPEMAEATAVTPERIGQIYRNALRRIYIAASTYDD